MRQESRSSSSSSSSPSSRTVGDLSVREREDVTNSDISDRTGENLWNDDFEIPEWLQEFKENLVDDQIP